MACKKTKPLSENQIIPLMDEMKARQDYNILAITALLMKATRVADVINTLKISDVFTETGDLREEIVFKESKTGKDRIIPIKGKLLTLALKNVYKSIKNKDRSSCLFYSQKGKFSNKPMVTTTVNRQLKKFVGMFGIEEISSHAIRKTACRLMLDRGINVAMISDILNHSNPKITYKYLGILSEDTKKALAVLEF